MIQIGNTKSWLWVAVEPVHRVFLGVYISRHRNMLVTEHFIKQFDEAIKYIHFALKYNPTNSFLWYTKGVIFYGASKNNTALELYSSAISEFEKALLLENRSIYYLGIADSLFNLERYPDALDAYKKTIELSDNTTDPGKIILPLAEKLYKLREYDAAIEYLDLMLSINSKDNKAYVIKGNSLFNLEQFKKALKSYKEALLNDPNNSTLLFYEGNRLSELKNYKKQILHIMML